MRVLADGLAFGHGLDDGPAEVLRMRAREADPLDPVDRVAGPQQLAELRAQVGCEVTAPRVDVLTEQGDLANTLGCEPGYLGDDLARPAAHFPPTHRRDDAVGALRIAAHGDLHPGLEGALAVHRQLAREAPLVH